MTSMSCVRGWEDPECAVGPRLRVRPGRRFIWPRPRRGELQLQRPWLHPVSSVGGRLPRKPLPRIPDREPALHLIDLALRDSIMSSATCLSSERSVDVPMTFAAATAVSWWGPSCRRRLFHVHVLSPYRDRHVGECQPLVSGVERATDSAQILLASATASDSVKARPCCHVSAKVAAVMRSRARSRKSRLRTASAGC